MKLEVLLTGATGFIGSKLVEILATSKDFKLVISSRRKIELGSCAKVKIVSSLGDSTDWSDGLAAQGVVIHAAARAHIMNDPKKDSLAAFRKVNVDGSMNLARQAAQAGVKRFIFISSIKVNGESTSALSPFRDVDTPAPMDAYGISKLEAEQGLKEIAKSSGMELVIIRPPLVYGSGVKGNFATLMRIVDKGWPLPLANTGNLRSFVSVWNLVDLIIRCIDHPAAAGQTLLVRDGEDISTSDLLRRLGEAAGKPVHLFPFPHLLLKWGSQLLGRRGIYDRLFDSLQVDDSRTRELLDWTPPLTLEQGLIRCYSRKS